MEKPPENRQIVIVLVWVFIFLALSSVVFWLLKNPQATIGPPSTSTQTAGPSATITPSPVSSLTSTPSPRPSWTLRPRPSFTPSQVLTATPTATQTRLPVLVKAIPYKYNDRYELNPWDFANADYLARLMLEAPDNLYPAGKQKPTTAYQSAFKFGVYAYREALLRFPESELASNWEWRLAYAMAQTGDPQAVDLYADLITSAVNQLHLFPDEIPGWFKNQEPNLTLYVTPLPSSINSTYDWLLEIKDAGVFFLLRQTAQEAFIFPLTDEFNFMNGASANWITGDPDQDGKVEVILYLPDVTDDTRLTTPIVYDLSQNSPLALPIEQSLPFAFQQFFKLTLNTQIDQDQTSLVLSALIYPACPVTYQRTYTWQGGKFLLKDETYSLAPVPEHLTNCDVIIEHALTVWGPRASLPLLEALLNLWPPPLDAQGFPYPSDAMDKLKYQIGLSLAFSGSQEEAITAMDDIINTPSVTSSTWIKPAQEFVATFQAPQDLYRACIQSPLCIPRQAVEQTIMDNGSVDLSESQDYLLRVGVPIRSAGVFDFDEDGRMERWLTIQHHPGETLEFWILAQDSIGLVHAIFVNQMETGSPQPSIYPYGRGKPISYLGEGNYILLERLSDTQEPFITFAEELEAAANPYTKDETMKAVDELLLGKAPEDVRDELLAVLESGRFNCKAHKICDLFYYTLGLAYELSGNEREAVDTYIQLWWENSSSPFTSMARLKLHFIQTPTRTPTATTQSTTDDGTPYP